MSPARCRFQGYAPPPSPPVLGDSLVGDDGDTEDEDVRSSPCVSLRVLEVSPAMLIVSLHCSRLGRDLGLQCSSRGAPKRL